MKIDLHIHSTFSDGQDTPTQIVNKLSKLKVEYASLTDHDTVSGTAEFLLAAKNSGIKAIPGIELSAVRHKEVHILGYNVDFENPKFLARLQEIKNLRSERNTRILKTLQKYKVYISEKDIESKSGETIGRMHIAKVMKDKGYVSSVGEAFDKFLAHGKKAYIKSFRLSPKEAIELVKKYGGVPVLAHPYKLNLSLIELFEVTRELKGYGLEGIEAYYVGHSEVESKRIAEMADELKLIPTCGSDYHGELRTNALGEVSNNLTTQMLSKILKE